MFPILLQAAAGAGDTDLLDSLIYVAIVLFILSAITEKVTQLVRCYPKNFQIISILLILFFYGVIIYSWIADLPPGFNKECRITGLDGGVLIGVNTFFLLLFILNLPRVKRTAGRLGWIAREMAVLKNINKATPNDPEKTRDVSLLSFILGFLIAYLFNASLLDLFSNPGKHLGWDERPVLGDSLILNSDFFGFDIAMAVGFLITGFFLAFGSRFFHDLLDTLLQVKNLKRKLNDEATFEVENIEQFDEYVAKSSSSIVELAIEQNNDKFNPDLLRISPLHGRMRKMGRTVDCIDLHLKGNSREDIPEFVEAKLERGQRVKVPVNFIYNVEVPSVKSAQGDEAQVESQEAKGTICCKLKNNQGQILLLTCSHVLNDGSAKNNFGRLTEEVPASIGGLQNGNFVWAMRSDKFDVALIQPEEGDPFEYVLPIKKERALTAADMLTTQVCIVRQNGLIDHGHIVNHKFPGAVKIQYEDGEFGMVDLIILSKAKIDDDEVAYEGITSPGDSGAAVYDGAGYLIGMIIAGSTKFSYATAMPDILTKVKSTIIT